MDLEAFGRRKVTAAAFVSKNGTLFVDTGYYINYEPGPISLVLLSWTTRLVRYCASAVNGAFEMNRRLLLFSCP